jgi:hypothetical protein
MPDHEDATMLALLHPRRRPFRGAALAEYAILLGAIGAIALAGLTALGLSTSAGLGGVSSGFAAGAPVITSISPPSGPVGTDVILTGTNLKDISEIHMGAMAIPVDGTHAWSDGPARAGFYVPIGVVAGPQPVTVTGPRGTSPAQSFTVAGA